MADIVGSVDIVRRVQVTAAEELLLLPTDQGLVHFQHGDLLPSDPLPWRGL
jgi:hypothetical protein